MTDDRPLAATLPSAPERSRAAPRTAQPLRWQVDISLAKEPPFRFVALTLGCTYVNAFQAEHLDAAFKAYTDSELATVIVLFPREKRARDLRFVQKVDDKASWTPITPAYLLEHSNSVYFRVDRPERDHTYRVQWRW